MKNKSFIILMLIMFKFGHSQEKLKFTLEGKEENTIALKIVGNNEVKYNKYIIKWGDTLSMLAIKNNIKVENLQKINGIKNINLIIAGILLIPKILTEVKKIPSTEKTFINNYNDELFILKNNISKKIEILDNQFKLIYELKMENGNFENVVATSEDKIIFNQGNKTYLLKNKNELLEFDFLIQENTEKIYT